MEFIADLHIHSYLSRATAKNLNLEHLNLWAQMKGISVVGTGDFTHPQWFSELSEKLEPAEEGLFALKSDYAAQTAGKVPSSCRQDVRFVLSVEISSIYKKDGKTRKVHNVILVPTLEAAGRLNERLGRIGNIASDGRPILGLDSKLLLEIALETCPDTIFIPAHIWTPWFSVLGSKSGFDSLDACFEDLTDEIFAVETGLSSDPAMNWRVSSLDRFCLVSNSDAHSPSNLGREANLFSTQRSYPAMRKALKTREPGSFLGTLEYFAEEGKYHFDGHRKCGVRFSPVETRQTRGLCPVCGKPMTIGVTNRVEELADREPGQRPDHAPGYTSLLPLTDILSEVLQVGPKAKKVDAVYGTLLEKIGPEFVILRHAPLDALERYGPVLLAEAIRRMREGQVDIAPGFDGEFGTICLFSESERLHLLGQGRLFPVIAPGRIETQGSLFGACASGDEAVAGSRTEWQVPGPCGGVQSGKDVSPANMCCAFLRDFVPTTEQAAGAEQATEIYKCGDDLLADLNPEQREAARHVGSPLMIVAGPGTGKTRTLTYRIAYLLQKQIALPEQILAVTFTNKAAGEMRRRLQTLIADESVSKRLTIRTFHSLCLDILGWEAKTAGNDHPVCVLGEADRLDCVKKALADICGIKQGAASFLEAISLAKQRLQGPGDGWGEIVEPAALHDVMGKFEQVYGRYQDILSFNGAVDFDDLISGVVHLFEQDASICHEYRQRFPFISVDEYQDINHAQYRLVRLLAPPTHDLCVIGDPDQAIYGFRGADVQYFKGFQDDYAAAKIIHLTQNYRSTETILAASAQVLPHADGLCEGKALWSGIHGAKTLTVVELPTVEAEAEHIAKTIESEVGGISHFSLDSGRVHRWSVQGERSFSDFAVLYRAKDQAKALEKAFARSGIPYQGQGEMRIEDQKGIRDLLATIKVIGGVALEFDMERMLYVVADGAGRSAVDALKAQAEKAGVSLLAFINGDGRIPGLDASVTAALTDVREKIGRARRFLAGLETGAQIQWVSEHFRIRESVPDEEMFEKHVKILQDMAEPFGRDIRRFITHLALEQEQDRYEVHAEKVTLMTMHASKGLEFAVVFIVGCEDGLIPYKKSGVPCSMHEEGRLFYVALTRAKERLFLTHVKERGRFGKTMSQRISPFVEAIEKDLKETVRPNRRRAGRPKAPFQQSLF